MDMVQIVHLYAPIALSIFVLGVAYRVFRHLYLILSRNKPRGRTAALDTPKARNFWESVRIVFTFPFRRFAHRSNKMWSYGAMFYHLGIITIVVGYSLSMVILLFHLVLGHPVPDIAKGIAESDNTSLANLAAIIFGNAEPLQSEFLFGSLAPIFIWVTWPLVLSALIGNSLLLITHLLKKGGAIKTDLDPAAKGVRVSGIFKWSHLIVTALVFAIVWTEILARLEITHQIVFYHSFLALTMILIFPFSYLFHMMYAFVGVYYAARRWQNRTVA